MIALTIDSEQWNCPLLEGEKAEENNTNDFSRKGNEILLDLLRKHNIKATFFITGFFAENEPQQVKKIASLGHEIACHGYNHHYRGNKNFDLEEDIKKAKKILEVIVGKKVIGFRAPQLQYSEDLLKILNRLGFKYDSSLHPTYLPGCYNNLDKPLRIFKPLNDSGILEIPLTVSPCRLPVSWMFMRIFGVNRTINSCKKSLEKGFNAVIYIHSWEFISIKSKLVPFYYKYHTGDTTTKLIEKFILSFKDRGITTLENLASHK